MQAWAQVLHPGLEGSLALRPSSKVLMLGAGVLTTQAVLWSGGTVEPRLCTGRRLLQGREPPLVGTVSAFVESESPGAQHGSP